MREKLIDIVEAYADFLDWDTKEEMVDSIMKFLATDNNVGDKILCQNCTHHDTEDCPQNRVWCKMLRRYMKLDGYCSFGEKE